MKVLILGAKGMLGSELSKQLSKEQVTAYDYEQLDITDRQAVLEEIKKLKPEIIFNCAAYNAVDKAEEQHEVAMRLNADAVGYIAEAANSVGATLVHFSTGFIFDGSSKTGYNEESVPAPQSIYAKSKYLGELQAQTAKKFYIVRLNLLFGEAATGPATKQSFPDLILGLAKEKKEFDFVSDEISTPTYAPDLASAVISLVKERYPFGIYHLPNEGQASWYDFAKEVFNIKGLDVKLNKITADQYPRPAERPKNSVVINTKYPKLRPWQQALQEYLTEK